MRRPAAWPAAPATRRGTPSNSSRSRRHTGSFGARMFRRPLAPSASGSSRVQASDMIDAVVFDLDGVIIDSEPVWEQVRRNVVAEHGGDWAHDAQQRLMGMSTPEWA